MLLNRHSTRSELRQISQRYGAAGFSGYVSVVNCTKISVEELSNCEPSSIQENKLRVNGKNWSGGVVWKVSLLLELVCRAVRNKQLSYSNGVLYYFLGYTNLLVLVVSYTPFSFVSRWAIATWVVLEQGALSLVRFDILKSRFFSADMAIGRLVYSHLLWFALVNGVIRRD